MVVAGSSQKHEPSALTLGLYIDLAEGLLNLQTHHLGDGKVVLAKVISDLWENLSVVSQVLLDVFRPP